MRIPYLHLTKADLQTERLQCEQEGRDFSDALPEFERLMEADLEDSSQQAAAQVWLDDTLRLPSRPDYPFHEPSDLDGIRATRPKNSPPLPIWAWSDDALFEKLYGAWVGRCAGCLLGKPVEGWRRDRMWGYLKETGREPLSDYFSLNVPETIQSKYELPKWAAFKENVTAMPEDDDLNYTTAGLIILEQHGRDFSPEHVANFWLLNLPILHTYTAERVAYHNLVMGITPPRSALYRNPFREWIGAQIRADFWGYANPGDMERAAEYAWRDAVVSHVKNGIYGEMWVAAMIAAAFVTENIQDILLAGLAQIPEQCRLANRIHAVMEWRQSGMEYMAAIERVHTEWDETRAHDWCHTISNAMLVAIGLLWGESDFESSITKAVYGCFDTDCNGATVGSILGAIYGRSQLPDKWTAILNDTLETGIAGYHRVSLREMAERSLRVVLTQR